MISFETRVVASASQSLASMVFGSIFFAKTPVRVIVEEHTAQIVPTGAETVAEGMPLRIASQEFRIASTGTDDYGRTFGVAEVSLPDGAYDGTVVVERTRPIDFLLESR